MKTVTTDCLILGGGLAGWMAAREAAHAGLRVALLRDGQGASPWVHGINIPLHPRDSVKTFLADTLQSGQNINKPQLAEALCADAPDMLHEIERLGLSFNRDGEDYQFLQPLGASWPRVMSIGNETGAALLAALQAELNGKVTVYSDHRAIRLLGRERVTGALAFDCHSETWAAFRASATVLACGGFCGIFPVSTNKRDSGGDGPAMAFNAGADLCDMEFIQFEPSGAVWPAVLRGTSMITTMFYEGAVLRNRSGERFMLRHGPEGEQVNKDRLAECIAREIDSGNGTEHQGVYFDATAISAETLHTLYPSYIKRYRDVGIDLSREWIELAPAPHTSLGGISTDANGASALEGLFACGEVMGGLHGANRIGGSAGLETLVFGRRAGRAAAAYAANHPADSEPIHTDCFGIESTDCRENTPDLEETFRRLRCKLQTALRTGANVLRNGKTLSASLDTLQAAQAELSACDTRNPREQFIRFRLENDITTAILLCTSALARKDSTGCHIRTDKPQKAATAYRVTLCRHASGDVKINKEPAV